MKASTFRLYVSSTFAIATILGGCGGPESPIAGSVAPQQSYSSSAHRTRSLGTQWPVQHLIVVIQQARTFDDLFAGYPGADAPTSGCARGAKSSAVAQPMSSGSGCPPGDTKVPLKPVSLGSTACRDAASFSYYNIAWDNGAMDGWNQLDQRHPLCPYTHVTNTDTGPYWKFAKSFAIADHMFASTRFGGFANQYYLLAGTSQVARRTFVIGPPTEPIWGCHAPPGTTTTVLRHDRIDPHVGPFPCFDQFPTIADLLDHAAVSWRYYYDQPGIGGGNWNAFTSIKDVFEGQDWSRDMSAPATNVVSDIAGGNLTSVSWVLSPRSDSDSPGTRGGPKWVNSIIRAVEKIQYLANTAVVVTWIDVGNGQFYDNVAPPQLDVMGLGFRVPLIAASKFAKRHYVSHVQYEFASILKFIEENWALPPLGGGATDQRANSITDMFDFSR